MAQPYVGEIKMFAGNYEPEGWMFCSGQVLPIAGNELFRVIGTTYGGNGQSTFALPDLRSRVPIHQGPGLVLAKAGGAEAVTLTVSQLPAHSHSLLASTNSAGNSTPTGNLTGQVGATQIYREVAPTSPMSSSSMSPTGGSQPHTNIQPFLTINFIISLSGVLPSQS